MRGHAVLCQYLALCIIFVIIFEFLEFEPLLFVEFGTFSLKSNDFRRKFVSNSSVQRAIQV